ncbi:unnamed protein product [Cunninghamella blakesleeana]
MITLLLAYLLLGLLFYIEYRYESSRATTMLQTSGDDQGTTTLLVGMWSIALLSGLIWPLVGLGNMEDNLTTLIFRWIGVGWVLGGIILLRWAIHVNSFYLRPMATTDNQYICTDGPYKVIRHPGYLAFIIAWIGFSLATGNWIVCITISLMALYAYIRRINAEEQMLLDHFSVDYQQYMNESFRIIPFVF